MTERYGYGYLQPESYGVLVKDMPEFSRLDLWLRNLAYVQKRLGDAVVVLLGALLASAITVAVAGPATGAIGPVFGLLAFLAWSAMA
jgi:hypothetical protein